MAMLAALVLLPVIALAVAYLRDVAIELRAMNAHLRNVHFELAAANDLKRH